MDESAGATVVKDSIGPSPNGTNPGTPQNGPLSNTNGRVGTAWQFDGADDNISIGSNGFQIGAGPRTVSAWVKTTSSALEEVFSYGTASTGRAFTVGVWGGTIFVSAYEGPQYQFPATGINNGAWHHIAVSFDGSFDGSNLHVYYDGSALATQLFTPINTTLNSASIGSRISPAEFFNGQIDEVGLWNRALTGPAPGQNCTTDPNNEICALYNGGTGTVCPAPTATPTSTPSPLYKRVFVSSTTTNGNIGGLAGADAKCQNLANAQPALAGSTWKAWLSDSTTSASSRLAHSTVPYVLVNSTTIANNWTDLTDGSLLASPKVYESGTPASTGPTVWTNTNPDGTSFRTSAGSVCNDWTDGFSTTSLNGIFGWSDLSTSEWTQRISGTVNCTAFLNLYCFEQ